MVILQISCSLVHCHHVPHIDWLNCHVPWFYWSDYNWGISHAIWRIWTDIQNRNLILHIFTTLMLLIYLIKLSWIQASTMYHITRDFISSLLKWSLKVLLTLIWYIHVLSISNSCPFETLRQIPWLQYWHVVVSAFSFTKDHKRWSAYHTAPLHSIENWHHCPTASCWYDHSLMSVWSNYCTSLLLISQQMHG